MALFVQVILIILNKQAIAEFMSVQ